MEDVEVSWEEAVAEEVMGWALGVPLGVATLAMEEGPTMASQGPIPPMGSGTPMQGLTAMVGLMGPTLGQAKEDISHQATLEDPLQGR